MKQIILHVIVIIEVLSMMNLYADGVFSEKYLDLDGCVDKVITYSRSSQHISECASPLEQEGRGPCTLASFSRKNKKLFDGNIYLQQGNYSNALSAFKEGISYNEGDTCYATITCKLFEGIGGALVAVGEYEQAKQCYERALVIERDNAHVLYGLGNLYKNIGDYEKSLKYYNEALALYKNGRDQLGETEVLVGIAVVNLLYGNYHESLEHLNNAYNIQREAKDYSAKIAKANSLSGLGIVYRHLGLYTEALCYFNKALELRKELLDKAGESAEYTNIGNTYLNIYAQKEHVVNNICTNLNDCNDEKILEKYQKALMLSCEIDSKRGVAINLNNIGDFYKETRNYQEALRYFQYAEQISEKIGDASGRGVALLNLGETYKSLQQYNTARDLFRESIALFENTRELETIWRAQAGLASTEARLNQPEKAIELYEQALDSIEKIRGNVEEKNRPDFMQNKLFIYDEFIALLQREHQKHPTHCYDRKAFEIFERKQGRSFLEQMSKSAVRRFGGVAEEIVANDQSLENQVVTARKELHDAYVNKLDTESPQKKLDLAVEKQRAFEEELKISNPKYYALKYPKPVELADLQQNVLESDEVILIYNVRKEGTDLWCISEQYFKMFFLPLTEENLSAQIKKFRDNGVNRADLTKDTLTLNYSLEKGFASFAKSSHGLYRHLFPDVVFQWLAMVQPKLLYIVPSSDLYQLPFEALVTDNTANPIKYLIQDYAISYLSSASLLKTLRYMKLTEKNKRQPLLAFAHSIYPKQNCDLKSEPSEDKVLIEQVMSYYNSLQGGGLNESGCPKELFSSEVEEIALSLKIELDENNFAEQDKTSRQTVLTMSNENRLDNFQYIIFSTHGLLPSEITPLVQPALLLSHSNPLEKEEDDKLKVLKGFLTMNDVFRLKMNADMIVLSACNVGLGQKVKGEGTIGLTRAFMYAGSSRVSVTLWSVENRATEKLNVKWFKNLKDHSFRAGSLRQAKLEMLNEKDYHYPYMWAGVVMFGDGK